MGKGKFILPKPQSNSMLPFVLIAVILLLCIVICYYALQQQSVSSVPVSSEAPSSSVSSEPAVIAPPPETGSAVPADWLDGGIFSDCYEQAFERLSELTKEEKIGQLFLARCPGEESAAWIEQYHPGGFVLFGEDFKGKTQTQVQAAISSYQQASSIPMLMAVDEEGGSVVRISSNPALAQQPFPSPMQLYQQGGLEAIRQDALQKAELLTGLGIQMNLAPVCDVSTDKNDYIYSRTLGKDAQEVSAYVETVVKASTEQGISSTLKHFPGYGNNADTHTGVAVDRRALEELEQSDFLPFSAGIQAGAQAVLVSHNIVEAIDGSRPASLSPAVHTLLREKFAFTGLIMTDDLAMQAITDYTGEQHPAVAALLAGNDLLLVDDLPGSVAAVGQALSEGVLSQEQVDHAVFRILAMKLHTGQIQS